MNKGISININGGNAAIGTVVQGDSNEIRDNHQTSSNYSLENSLTEIADDLAKLRVFLKERAKTVEEDRAVVAVGEAEDAARKGDRQTLLTLLKKAGEWSLKVATNVGMPVAQKAIEAALGL
ncbi:hypothetical protein [Novosphingobium sp. NDB2Meth1]|uniref:hypothetical protein n=1 Tax=Novosphingobium sp. NDB2Meth1 TaxID=1892847 RepID=UPI000AAE5AB5|nr:hypothetical protein [Novosphingobium sp. NDB2Meth1]